MISIRDNHFILDTRDTTMVLGVLPTGQIEHLYWGDSIRIHDFLPLKIKITAGAGSSVAYSTEDKLFSLDLVPLAWSGSGKGDFRHSPMELLMPDGSFVTDFVYREHRITRGNILPEGLPASYGPEDECSTLMILLADRLFDIELRLFWTVYEKTNMITRRCEVTNRSGQDIRIRKIMSFMVDFPADTLDLLTFDGGWSKETHTHRRTLSYGIQVNDSTTGASSNRHNTGFIVAGRKTGEDSGTCWAFNLVYSGNHYSVCELSNHNILRIMSGISPHQFDWPLASGETFTTPEAFMTYSSKGFNGLSAHMHEFIRNHIVRGKHKNRPRPVLMNNWEATFFDFNEAKILKMAREAKKLGIELIVLDDGWFGARNNDFAGLGDYAVNRKKLPGGLSGLAKKIKGLGMDFGLWFEPEMVNEDSELFRAYPEYAVRVPGREPARGRNQLVLDLTRPEVRDYIVEQVNSTLGSADISYVKWDMNRHITDMYSSSLKCQGMFFHAYILGLYNVLGRIVEANPEVLFESCSSGGNRFDPGMLCFMPQVWSSDDTDPGERLKIQEGLSYLYPPSVMGAHLSASPHQQTLRRTRISTRCHVSAFGLFGLELDLTELDRKEREEIARFIQYYKKRRETFQFGRFYRFDREKENIREFQLVDATDASVSVYGFFQTLAEASPPFDTVKLKGLDPESLYRMETVPSTIDIREFGGLLKHAMPVQFKPNGIIMNEAGKHYRLPACTESYTAFGSMLSGGIKLKQRFTGTGYNENIRLLSDFGSELFDIERIDRKAE